jgi:hypothetical protein
MRTSSKGSKALHFFKLHCLIMLQEGIEAEGRCQKHTNHYA